VTSQTRTPRARLVARIALYVLASPIVVLMGKSLVEDPGRIGTTPGATGMPMPAFVVIAGVITAVLLGLWALSEFRFRTPTLLVQVAVVWIGGYLYQDGVRQEISAWDVVEDAVLLATTLLQLLPAPRDRTG
jgi:hypothetical protein